MPLIRRNLVHKAWRRHYAGKGQGLSSFYDFCDLVGITMMQWVTIGRHYSQVKVSAKCARKIKVLAEYPPCHHYTLLKAIDATYMNDPPEE